MVLKSVYYLFFLLGVGIPLSHGQGYYTKKTITGKAKRLYERAIQYNRGGYTDKAIKDFNSTISLEPNFIDAHYQLAAVFFNKKRYDKAIAPLEKVLEIDPAYKPRAHYYLGIIYEHQDQFEKGAFHFSQFLQSGPGNAPAKRKATVLLRNCRFAAEAIKNPVSFNPMSLGPTINSSFPEYLPSLTADGQTLVFTRRIQGDEDVFISHQEEEGWSEPRSLQNINTTENEGPQYISADGNLIVFVRCSDRKGFGGCDLYYSEKQSGAWSKPRNMGAPINTRAWESQPSLSADGNLLFFASNRKGSLGGKDIWRSARNEDGSWSNPINLGSIVNTPDDDESPFFHPDGQTLYFMSKGHPGMGGFDLFMTRKGEGGRWTAVKNLGYPINTKGNEGALFLSVDGTKAYFARDYLPEKETEKLNSIKQPDIYSFEFPLSLRPNPVTYVKATVRETGSNKRLENARVEVVNLLTREVITRSITDPKGIFLACLPLGASYALNVGKEQYLFHSENFELTDMKSSRSPFLLDINLQPVFKGIMEEDSATTCSRKPVVLKNIFFESGSAELREISFVELIRLKELMQTYEKLKIQINGHTDNVGEESRNLELSEKRARAVMDYLRAEGIEDDRLVFKGFGESQPIDSNDTEEGRKRNRRTEFIIVN